MSGEPKMEQKFEAKECELQRPILFVIYKFNAETLTGLPQTALLVKTHLLKNYRRGTSAFKNSTLS